MSKIESFKDLIVYQKAYKLAMRIFELSEGFPKEEKYSLTDQIRRSSRSVTSNIAEAWPKRRYEKSFISKLIDSLGEEHETDNWLDFSRDCRYISENVRKELGNEYLEIRRMLISMINNPDQWCGSKKT